MMIDYMKCAYRAICFYYISEPSYLNYTIQIKIAMNELNKLIIDTIAKYKDDPKEAIQVFFQLLGTEPQENHQNIRKAILFSMENMHDWSNIIKYSSKWKFTDFQKGFISRMRLRVNELPPAQEPDVVEEMKRLVEKYWMTRSPKKGENVYRQPIIIKALMRNAKSLAPKDQYSFEANPIQIAPQQPTGSIEVNKQPQVERKQSVFVKTETLNQLNEKTHTNEGNVYRGDSFGPQQADSNASLNAPQKKQKLDPLASVTGRPPILKKKSLFDNNIKILNSSNESKEEKKKEEIAKGRMANSKIFNIMRKFGDRDEVKSTESWQNFGKAKESNPPIVNKANEEFPVDKFNFGSNKKGSGDIDMKKISISPRRYDPSTKMVKVIRNDPNEEKKPESLHQFSFASSEQKDSQNRQLQAVPSFKPIQQPSSLHPVASSEEQKFVFHDNPKDSDKDQNILGENESRRESFKRLRQSPAETPVFTFDSKKRRSSGGNKLQEAFEVDEALNLYHAEVKLRYFNKEIEIRNGADTMTIFQEEFSRFLKDPEAFRV